MIEHGSATVGFDQYQSVLGCAKRVLPHGSQVPLLADRGFEHGNLIHWLEQQNWSWAIRVKSDLKITLFNGCTQCYERLSLPKLVALPNTNPRSGCASLGKRDVLDCRIEFSKVVKFS